MVCAPAAGCCVAVCSSSFLPGQWQLPAGAEVQLLPAEVKELQEVGIAVDTSGG
jgi:hypothetical protein